MNMSIPLLAAEGQDVDPFRTDTFADSLSRFIDGSLENQIFLEGEIASHLLLMLYRGDQCVSV